MDEARAESGLAFQGRNGADTGDGGSTPGEMAQPSTAPAAIPGLESLIELAGSRVGEIISAVEELSVAVREDARREADLERERLRAADETRRSELERLLSGLRPRLRELAAALVRSLAAIDEIAAALAGDRTDGAQEPAPGDPTAATGESPRQPRDDGGEDRTEPGEEVALLRATQMAIEGRERGEIEAVVREQFGIDDPVPVVDKILGTGRLD